MRRARTIFALLAFTAAMLMLAPAALARDTGGQGWYGETTDPVITKTMFIVIVFFPIAILVFSLIQGQLDKRKHARMDAARHRAVNADWRGGW